MSAGVFPRSVPWNIGKEIPARIRETLLVSSFSKRHGYRRPLPERDVVEEAPEAVRALLRRMMLDDWGALGDVPTYL